MVKRPILLLLCTSLLTLAACQSDHIDVPDTPAEQVAVAFTSATTDEADTTAEATRPQSRAGRTGAMTTETLQRAGFGVFAYYTGTTPWDSYKASLPAPNFMYNQEVAWNYTQALWQYKPLKYWPNDNAKADNTGATGSKSQSLLSFFAYAPYVDLTQATNPASPATPTGDATSGITAISGNAATGDPQIHYALDLTDTDKQVDLLWGTRGALKYSQADGADNTIAALGPDQLNTDLQKLRTDERVSFLFRHALTSIDVYVQRIYDEKDPGTKKPENEKTKIFVSSFSLGIPANNIYTSGIFDLATGEWQLNDANQNAAALNLGTGMERITQALRGTTDDNASLASVQAVELNNFAAKAGVTEKPARLTTTGYVSLFLPTDGAGLTLGGIDVTPTITYNFVSEDDDLPHGLPNQTGTHRYSRTQHTVTATAPVKIGTKYTDGGVDKYRLEAGKHYLLICYIGTEHVSFQFLNVEDWDYPLRFDLDLGEGYIDDEIPRGLDEE